MKLYKDEALKEEVSILEFGRVEVGDSKVQSYWLHNDSNAIIEDISIELEKVPVASEVKILTLPKELRPLAKAKVEISWEPTLKIQAGLKVGTKILGTQVWS